MSGFIEPLDTVNDIVLSGTRLKDLLKGTGLVSCTFDADVTLATQIQFSYSDPDFAFTRKNTRFRMGSAATFGDYRFQVSRIEISDNAGQPMITVALRSDAVRKLKGPESQGKLTMTNVSPSQFITVECRRLGISSVVQPSPKRNIIARDVKEKGEAKRMDPAAADNEMSNWSTFQRFSQETGYMMFENAGTVYFGQAEWLVERDSTPLTLATSKATYDAATGRRTRSFNLPTCSSSIDSKVSDVSAAVDPTLYAQVQPGQALKLRGVPGFSATFLLTKVTYDMMAAHQVDINAQTPINQLPAEGEFADGGHVL